MRNNKLFKDIKSYENTAVEIINLNFFTKNP